MNLELHDIGKLFGQVNDGDFILTEKKGNKELERVNRGSSSFTRAVFYKQKVLSDGDKNFETRKAIFEAITKGETNKYVLDKISDALGLEDPTVSHTPLKCRVVADILSVKSGGVAPNRDQTLVGIRAAAKKAKEANAEVKGGNVEKAPEQNNDIKLDNPQVKYRDDSEVVAGLGEIKIDRPNYHTTLESQEKLNKLFQRGLKKLDGSFTSVMNATKPAFKGKTFGELYPNIRGFCEKKNLNLRATIVQDEMKFQECLNQIKEMKSKIKDVESQIRELEGDEKSTEEQIGELKKQNQKNASKVVDLGDKAHNLQNSIIQNYSEYINSCQKTLQETFMNVDTDTKLAEKLKNFVP